MQKELTEIDRFFNVKLEAQHNRAKNLISPVQAQKQQLSDSKQLIVEEQVKPQRCHFPPSQRQINHEDSLYQMTSGRSSAFQLGNSAEAIRAGYLQKETDSFIKPWNTCYCLLTPKKLLCFEDETRTKMISCLNFKKVDCQAKITDDSGTVFSLIYGEESIGHTFKAENMQQAEYWLNDIIFVIKSFITHPKLKIRKGSQQLYHHQDTLLESEFFEIAQSGDILLMKTNDSKCAIQRLVTNSQYDHISMVIKFPNGQVKIFEANADQGVQLYDWETFNRKFSHYQKICHRRLCHPEKEDFHPQLVSFMKKMIGKEYSFGAMKLFRKSSNEESAEVQSDFFCSELIAKAYKGLGILDKKKASNSYWPVDFTDRGGLVLEGEGYFGFEKLIILKRHLKLFQ